MSIEDIIRRVVREEIRAALADARTVPAAQPLALPSQVEYLTETQVSERIGIAKITLGIWRRNGEGPAFSKVGRRAVRYSWSDVQKWMAAGSRGTK